MLAATSSFLLWPAIIALPLIFTYNDNYSILIPTNFYDDTPKDYWNVNKEWPSPIGLSLGILAVIVGQIFVLTYFFIWKAGYLGSTISIQKEGPPKYSLITGLKEHLSQPEGFIMLGGYLIITWMFGLMPSSYYSFSGGINWPHVALQLLITDCIQFIMHLLEHKLDSRLYRISHKPHHRFTNPKLFDAFNGSPTDTLLMILVPLGKSSPFHPFPPFFHPIPSFNHYFYDHLLLSII
jgi:sterol desaturase/sphingolipid hydroxylase (fatty acid hydroxylase superfamily)